MVAYIIRADVIDDFKRHWPCHGLPDNLHILAATFAANGDLIDIEAYAVHDNGETLPLDTRGFDGPALVALVDDTKTLGDICD